jgi:hypothetical protein
MTRNVILFDSEVGSLLFEENMPYSSTMLGPTTGGCKITLLFRKQGRFTTNNNVPATNIAEINLLSL